MFILTFRSRLKVGAIILNDKKILVVRKYVKGHNEFIIPGGKKEGDEKPLETLQRELKEELSIDLKEATFFKRFEDIAVFENIPIIMDVYEVSYSGTIKADSEIKEYIWVSKDYFQEGINLGSVLSKHIIPQLVSKGKM